ncbi:lysosome-associated membrane glycoprotein 3 isoform X2 [Ahaetulla prasina]|uniref:lysosome-associated membrane glycoprotein 3 isoform X2 n=1 Tax=Ahaetulla prasina TaxID=499056 RepID=UPI002648091B|nr:lysosome-associated membrane glycoprotein 3 isoform X2 [Ahaetulla prasina]
MSRWKPFIEFLLITAGVFSGTGHALDKEAPARTTLRPASFLQKAPLPDRSPPSNSQATIHPSQALANQLLGHSIEQGIPSAPKAEMLKAESIPLTKSQAAWKPIAAARTTLLPSEPQTDWTETHKTRTVPQETTSTPPLPASRKKATPVLSTTKEDVNTTVSRATERHTTKLRKHTSVEKPSSATHKSVTSSPMPTRQTGSPLAPQPSPAVRGTYSVSNGTAECIKALIGLTMIVTNVKTGDLEYFNIDPNATHTSGYCGYDQSMLNISFEGGFIHFIFTKKEKIYYISMIEASLIVLSQEEECMSDTNMKLIPAAIGFSLSGLFIIILFSCVLYRRKAHAGYSRI